MADTDESARTAALDLARAMAGWWQDRLGADLLGVYLMGSLAHGGFNRRYSDIDIAVIAERPLPEDLRGAMRPHAATFAPDIAGKLSLFWTDRTFAIGRFPPLDRADYLDHAVPLLERERVRPPRPTLAEVRSYLAGSPLSRWADKAEGFAAAAALDAKDHKSYLRALLYPARFVTSWITGRMVSNGEAVTSLRRSTIAGLDVELIARAFDCRTRAADPDALFAERTKLPQQVAACRRLVATASSGS